MGKCQSQESARDCAPGQLPVVDEPLAALVAGAPKVKSCIIKQTLTEMPVDAVDLGEDGQVEAFSKLLIKNLIVQECTVADQEEKDEETEVKAQALSVLQKVIQDECRKMDVREADLEHGKTAEAPKSSNEVVLQNIDNAMVEDRPEVPVKNVVNVTEAKVSGADNLVKNEETIGDPCPKCKGSGKTNAMGGVRGFSFMKSRCKQCSSEKISTLAATAGA